MAQPSIFTADELSNITEMRDENARIINDLGQVEIQLFLINEQVMELGQLKTTLQSRFKDLQTSEAELVNNLNEKYGIGTVDINTGEFIPEN